MKNINRREFLKLSGSSLVYGTIFLTGMKLPNKWSFLQNPPFEKELSFNEIDSLCVPISEESSVMEGTFDYDYLLKNARPKLAEIARERGLKREFNELADFKQRFYGIPSKNEFVFSYLEYVVMAEDFLYNQIEGLERKKVNWTPIFIGDNYEKDFSGRGFVGNNGYKTFPIRLLRDKNVLVSFRMKTPWKGSRLVLSQTEKDNWYIYLSANRNGLGAPFSELIPLAVKSDFTNDPSKYFNNIQMIEAFSEVVSYDLSKKLADEISIPNGKYLIDQVFQNLLDNSYSDMSEYRFLPEAYKWYQKNELNNYIALWKDGWENFRREILKG